MVLSKLPKLGMKDYITIWYRLNFKEQMIIVAFTSKKDQTRKLYWLKSLLMTHFSQEIMTYAKHFKKR